MQVNDPPLGLRSVPWTLRLRAAARPISDEAGPPKWDKDHIPGTRTTYRFILGQGPHTHLFWDKDHVPMNFGTRAIYPFILGQGPYTHGFLDNVHYFHIPPCFGIRWPKISKKSQQKAVVLLFCIPVWVLLGSKQQLQSCEPLRPPSQAWRPAGRGTSARPTKVLGSSKLAEYWAAVLEIPYPDVLGVF